MKLFYDFIFKHLDEGEYVIPMCTVFGLEDHEKTWLIKSQAKLNLKDQLLDRNKEEDGIEVSTSSYKVI